MHRRSSCSCCDAIRLSCLESSFQPSAVVSTGLALVDLTWSRMCCYLCFSTRYQLWFTWAHLALKMCWLIRGAMKLSYVMRSSMLCRCSLGSDICSKTYLCCSYESVYCLRIELSDFRSGRLQCLSLLGSYSAQSLNSIFSCLDVHDLCLQNSDYCELEGCLTLDEVLILSIECQAVSLQTCLELSQEKVF